MATISVQNQGVNVNVPAKQVVERKAFDPLTGISKTISSQMDEYTQEKKLALAAEKEKAKKEESLYAQNLVLGELTKTNKKMQELSADGVLDEREYALISSQAQTDIVKNLTDRGITDVGKYLTLYRETRFQKQSYKEELRGFDYKKVTDTLGNVNYVPLTPQDSAKVFMDTYGGVNPGLASLYSRTMNGEEVKDSSGNVLKKEAVLKKVYNFIEKARSFEDLKFNHNVTKAFDDEALYRGKEVVDANLEIIHDSFLYGSVDPSGYMVPPIDISKHNEASLAKLYEQKLLTTLKMEPFTTFETGDNGLSQKVKGDLREFIRVKAETEAKNIYSLMHGELYREQFDMQESVKASKLTGRLSKEVQDRIKSLATMLTKTYETDITKLGEEFSLAANAAYLNRLKRGEEIDDPAELEYFALNNLVLSNSLRYQTKAINSFKPGEAGFERAYAGLGLSFVNIAKSLSDNKPIVQPEYALEAIDSFLQNPDAMLKLKGQDPSGTTLDNIINIRNKVEDQLKISDKNSKQTLADIQARIGRNNQERKEADSKKQEKIESEQKKQTAEEYYQSEQEKLVGYGE